MKIKNKMNSFSFMKFIGFLGFLSTSVLINTTNNSYASDLSNEIKIEEKKNEDGFLFQQSKKLGKINTVLRNEYKNLLENEKKLKYGMINQEKHQQDKQDYEELRDYAYREFSKGLLLLEKNRYDEIYLDLMEELNTLLGLDKNKEWQESFENKIKSLRTSKD